MKEIDDVPVEPLGAVSTLNQVGPIHHKVTHLYTHASTSISIRYRLLYIRVCDEDKWDAPL